MYACTNKSTLICRPIQNTSSKYIVSTYLWKSKLELSGLLILKEHKLGTPSLLLATAFIIGYTYLEVEVRTLRTLILKDGQFDFNF